MTWPQLWGERKRMQAPMTSQGFKTGMRKRDWRESSSSSRRHSIMPLTVRRIECFKIFNSSRSKLNISQMILEGILCNVYFKI